MNRRFVAFLNDDARVAKLLKGLPEAFEMAGLELPRKNPAVGFLREHILNGFFLHEFGAGSVRMPDTSTERGYDVIIFGEKLSIKTVTGGGKIRLLWTPDSYKAGAEVTEYRPQYDLLVIHINWNQHKDGIYYIPKAVQCEVYDRDPKHYLNVPVGTNHRGAELTTKSKNGLFRHPDTIRLKIHWIKKGLNYTPYRRWEEFWETR